MKNIIFNADQKIPIKLWTDDITARAYQQAINTSKLPFVFRHIALMPDTHNGRGTPKGSVIATNNVLIPSAVGIDIGCGTLAVKTSIKEIFPDELQEIAAKIREIIPIGLITHDKPQDRNLMPKFTGSNHPSADSIVLQEYDEALKQLGTLGSEDHFIEFQQGSDGYVWITVHTGSRNLGFAISHYYTTLAKKINEQWFTTEPAELDLAFLPIETKEGQNYLRDMTFCIEYAKTNRNIIMTKIKKIIKDYYQECIFIPSFDSYHNYAALECHFGSIVMVHRKGVANARKGQLVVVGAQGSKSYVVCGKGNPESFMSCSPSAGQILKGRKMGGPQIQRGPTLEKVMQNQNDLVNIEIELTPLRIIRG